MADDNATMDDVNRTPGPKPAPLSGPAAMMALAVVALILLGAILGYRLGSSPLVDPDEGRNAEVSREMKVSGDFVLPTLNALPYLDKPVLYFIADAASLGLFGDTAGAARLPSLLMTLAGMVLVGWFGRRLGGDAAGFVAALAMAASPLVIAFARTVIFDSTLAFFISLAMIAFFLGVEAPPDSRFWSASRRWSVLAWIAIGFGILTKGPVALALPLLVAGIFAALRKRSRVVWDLTGVVAMLCVVLPWVIAISRRIPGFLEYVFVTETVERIATDKLKRSAPFWFFLPLLMGGAFPWSVILLQRFRSLWRRPAVDPARAYLLLWIIVPFLFFSLSNSKRPQYILPIIPAIALLTALEWRAGNTRWGTKLSGGLLALLGIFFFMIPLVPALHRKVPAAFASSAFPFVTEAGAAFLIAGVVSFVFAARKWAIFPLAAAVLLLPIVSAPLMRDVCDERSCASAAASLKRLHFLPGATLIGVKTYRASLSFYSRQPIILATTDGGELTSNYVALHPEMWTSFSAPDVKPLRWIAGTWASGCRNVYVVESYKVEMRAQVASHRPFLWEHAGMALYGCPGGIEN